MFVAPFDTKSDATCHAERLAVSVIIPTFKRHQDLDRCLAALAGQTLAPCRVVVVMRDEDPESRVVAERFAGRLPLRIATVAITGQIAAINTGLDHADGDVVAVTDDDAAPHADWVERIEHAFRTNPRAGAVGGRDRVYAGDVLEDGAEPVVGKLEWTGRVIGNHHIGVGDAREVDILKGVNWSFRRAAIEGMRLNQRLRGKGAQVNNEIDFCLRLRRAGWRMIYDPKIAVDHFPGVRHDADRRGKTYFHPVAKSDAAYNYAISVMAHFPPARRAAFAAWALLVGTRDYPGVVQWARLLISGDDHATPKLLATARGQIAGLRDWRGSPS
jgi:GT2 family glycosyltransferase